MVSQLPDILASVPVDGLGLDELAALANRALESRALTVDDGRTSDRVDARTIRFYQTLAILPKPEYEGRRAIYQREHLVRVIAAKQLQAEGYSLAQIQSALPARSYDDLTVALCTLAPVRATSAAVAAAESAHTPLPLGAFALAEGITILIDRSKVVDPDAIVRALSSALRSHTSGGNP